LRILWTFTGSAAVQLTTDAVPPVEKSTFSMR
jgi:hypothetical protein